MISLYAGLTSQTIDVFLQDSSSATGAGLAGLVFNSSNLTAYYRKGATGSATAITLATQTVGGVWSSGGFVEIDEVNMKGVYRLDVPNAMIDTEGFVTLVIRGAANLLSTSVRIDCRPLPVDLKKILGAEITGTAAQIVAAFAKFFNVATPTGTVNSLPDYAPGASGGVIIVGTNSAAVEFTAGVTISSTTGDALALTSTGGDGVGLVATGNGGGAGIRGAGGATGPGILGIGGATSGAGIRGTGQNNSQGIVGLGEGSGAGIQGTGGLTGPGMWAYGGATSGDGIKANGNGTGVDIRGDIVGNVTGTVSGNSTHDAAGVRSAIGMASANLDTQLGNIATATNAGDLATKVADSGVIITGTEISGTWESTFTDDNINWNVAPVTPAVSGYGLRERLQFDLPLGRVCTQLQVRGQWSGVGSVVNIFAYNTRTEVYDQLTNTNTNMGSRGSETLYSVTVPVDYIDTTSGISNTVLIEFRTINTNTSYRLRIDRALLYHIDEDAQFTMTAPTVNDIWSAPSRTLTDLGSEPSAAPTVSEIASGVWEEIVSSHIGVSGGAAEALADIPYIRLKTDQLTFTTTNQLDASVHSVTQSGFEDIFETFQITESYPATGVAPTPAQAALMSQQAFTNFNVVGTTISVFGLDGTTVVGTWTIDNSGQPTSRLRAT